MSKKLTILLFIMLVAAFYGRVQPTVEAQNPTAPSQAYQPPENCLPCHIRQYAELRQAVKSGYRSVSPTFNSLEITSNALLLIRNTTRDPMTGNILDYPTMVSLRPFYAPDKNIVSSKRYKKARDGSYAANDVVRAGFCLSCHAPISVLMGDDPNLVETPGIVRPADKSEDNRIPQIKGDPSSKIQLTINPDGTMPTPNGLDRRAQVQIHNLRPLRDFVQSDATGKQIFPSKPGALAPGANRNLTGASISCDMCHNTAGPDLERSLLKDGIANIGQEFSLSSAKVGSFFQAKQVKDNFHQSSTDTSKINYLRSSAFCNSCHDVRIPTRDVLTRVIDAGSEKPTWFIGRSGFLGQERGIVDIFRLENLTTEFNMGPYNSNKNPFDFKFRCQDCHMSLFPYTKESTYIVRDKINNRDLVITSPTPAKGLGDGSGFPKNFAADPAPNVSVPPNSSLEKRQVVTHYMTGCDVPLMSTKELNDRLNVKSGAVQINGVKVKNNSLPVPEIYGKDRDEYGTPIAIAQRREDLLKSAVRVDLGMTQKEAKLGEKVRVGVTAVALTGHRFPAGFSQERTTYIQLQVVGRDKRSGKDVTVYQSGYLVDKPHPETGEMEPDGNLSDEDLEHLIVKVNPYSGDNDLFQEGPDAGHNERYYFGTRTGLVLFRNELRRLYTPPSQDPRDNLLPFNRLRGKVLTKPHVEEIFPAAIANTVTNWRSLPPLDPRTYYYDIKLPSTKELAKLGIEIEGQLQVKVQVNFLHFPPVFLRYLIRAVGGVSPEVAKRESPFAIPMPDLYTEARLDSYLRNVEKLATAETTVLLK